MTGTPKPTSRPRPAGRTEAIRQVLHAQSRGRTHDCQSVSHPAGPIPFTAVYTDTEKVGWAKAQFPPCPLLARSVPQLVEAMWALRAWADNPSCRMLERRADRIERRAGTVRALPHATLHRVMTRCRMPRLEVLELFVKACGAEAHWDEWRRAWFAINADAHLASLRRRGKR